MKILTRYILIEFIAPFLLGLLCFTMVLLINEVFNLTKTFVAKDVNPWYLAELLIYVTPATLVVTIPMATLVGILLSFGRLSADNEIIAMKAIGIGLHQLMVPILILSFGISIFAFLFMDIALPNANMAYVRLMYSINVRHPGLILEEGIIMRELEREGRMWMFERQDPETGRLKNVRIWEEYHDGVPTLVAAKEAELDFSGIYTRLRLFDGVIYKPGKRIEDMVTIRFDRQEIKLELSKVLQEMEYKSKNFRSMNLSELRRKIIELRHNIQHGAKPYREVLRQQLNRAYVELHKKFSIPFACFAFGLIGVPLGTLTRKSGKMVGFGVGLSLILVYYVLLRVGETSGIKGAMDPMFGVWLPNIITGIGGIALAIQTSREAPFWLYLKRIYHK
jgi:LPS export ABC transporter permease LptF